MNNNQTTDQPQKPNGKHGRLGRFDVYQSIGFGATCKVKLGLDDTDHQVAIKILNSDLLDEHLESYQVEIEMLRKTSHPNVMTIIESGEDVYTNKNGKIRKVKYVVLEKAQGGELFDYIEFIDEDVARFYFR